MIVAGTTGIVCKDASGVVPVSVAVTAAAARAREFWMVCSAAACRRIWGWAWVVR